MKKNTEFLWFVLVLGERQTDVRHARKLLIRNDPISAFIYFDAYVAVMQEKCLDSSVGRASD